MVSLWRRRVTGATAATDGPCLSQVAAYATEFSAGPGNSPMQYIKIRLKSFPHIFVTVDSLLEPCNASRWFARGAARRYYYRPTRLVFYRHKLVYAKATNALSGWKGSQVVEFHQQEPLSESQQLSQSMSAHSSTSSRSKQLQKLLLQLGAAPDLAMFAGRYCRVKQLRRQLPNSSTEQLLLEAAALSNGLQKTEPMLYKEVDLPRDAVQCIGELMLMLASCSLDVVAANREQLGKQVTQTGEQHTPCRSDAAGWSGSRRWCTTIQVEWSCMLSCI